jgi:cyclopropane fatty-acyl-phospholipid synthase-like methyltransferase
MSEHLSFLKKYANLQPKDKLLDLGCGKLDMCATIEYLETGNYFGVDRNAAVVYGIGNVDEYFSNYSHERCAFGKITKHNLWRKRPTLWLSENFDFNPVDGKIDIIFCKDVFTHFDPTHIKECLLKCKEILSLNGVMFASFTLNSDGEYREGLDKVPGFKTFTQYSPSYLESIILSVGLKCEYMPKGILQLKTEAAHTMRIYHSSS